MKRSDRHSLSDGASRLFAFLCLEADRHTGRYEATQRDLAGALGKSKRIIGSYVAELEAKGVCSVRPGKNQFARTVFEITDRYWPRGIPLAVIQDAMLMGACRKYNPGSRIEHRNQSRVCAISIS